MPVQTIYKNIRVAFWAFLIVTSSNAIAQKEANIWHFGHFQGVDFNSGVPVSLGTGNVGGGVSEGCASISDANGNLLFYLDGDTLWDKNHNPMPNGMNLAGSYLSTQNSLIIPVPDNATRYYVFTQEELANPAGLQMYLVDMTLNGGMGDVILGSNQTLLTPSTEKLTAVRHANHKDYWLIAHRWNSNEICTFLVDNSGVSLPINNNVGTVHTGVTTTTVGYMKASPDGKRIALVNWNNHLFEVFDFDNATGIVTNAITLPTTADFPYGVEFSPDGSKLYMSYWNNFTPRIVQFDLDACEPDAVQNSGTVVGVTPFFHATGAMQLATDGKIYIATDDNSYLAVIHSPDLLGLDCNFQDSAVALGGGTVSVGLPNFVQSYFAYSFGYEDKCFGSPTTFYINDTIDVDSVSWDFGDPSTGVQNTSTLLSPMHTFSAADTFEVTLYKYINGQVDSSKHNTVIFPLPNVDLGNDTTLCTGDTLILDATLTNSMYSWFNGSTDSSVTINTAGDYWVDVCLKSCTYRDSIRVVYDNAPPIVDLGSDTSVCLNDSVILDPDLPYVYYTWSTGSHDTTLVVNTTGDYWLEVSNSCGSGSDTVFIDVGSSNQPVVNLGNDTLLCEGTVYPLDATNLNATYEWQDGSGNAIFNVNTGGEYWVEVQNSCDTVSDTVTISFDPQINFTLDDVELICDAGDSVVLDPGVTGVALLWDDNSNNTTRTVFSEGIYWVQASNACGTASDTTLVIAYFQNPSVINAGPDISICELDSAVIGDPDSPEFVYTWSDGTQGALRTVSDDGVYIVTGTNQCATETDSVIVSVRARPFIQWIGEQHVCQGETKELKLDYPYPATYSWSNGGVDTTIRVASSGEYSVTIIDDIGCVFTDSIFIGDSCVAQVFAPNVFTPNGDGLNDVFRVDTRNVVEVELSIFNRWGGEVFRTTEVSKTQSGWDGNVNGQKSPIGTYFWLVTYNGADGTSKTVSGSVSLFR